MFADVEPPHRFVRETPASVVHHADYLNHRDDHALCGIRFENPATLAQTGRDMGAKYKETSEGGLAANLVLC